MKRFLSILLLIALLCGCSSQQRGITLEEIVEAYEAAGYSVWADTYEEALEEGQIASVQANHPDGDYIYFSFFETEEQAAAYKKEFYHPMVMGLFAVIYGDPSWPRWKVYGNIVVEYDNPEFFEVFQKLRNKK